MNQPSPYPQNSPQPVLHLGHLLIGQRGQRPVAETLAVERTGLVGDDLAWFQEPVARREGDAPTPKAGVNPAGAASLWSFQIALPRANAESRGKPGWSAADRRPSGLSRHSAHHFA